MLLQFLTEIQSFWQSNKTPAILAGLSVCSIGVSAILVVTLIVKSVQSSSPIQFIGSHDVLGDSRDATGSAKPKNSISVDVEGGVRAPGLYELPSASRVDDAIAKAGGFSEEADREIVAQKLNRAGVLTDGMKIYVPKIADKSHILNQDSSLTSHIIDTSGTSQNGELVNINTASEEELDALSGVGPATAKKIIENRPYGSLEDLISKRAVGNALFERIKEKLTF